MKWVSGEQRGRRIGWGHRGSAGDQLEPVWEQLGVGRGGHLRRSGRGSVAAWKHWGWGDLVVEEASGGGGTPRVHESQLKVGVGWSVEGRLGSVGGEVGVSWGSGTDRIT